MLSRIAVACLMLSGVMNAQEMKSPPHVVRASGEATVTAKPDRAEMSIGVQTQAATAQEASAQNATQTSHVLDVIKRTLGSGGEVKTSGYSVSPQYQFPKDGGPGRVVDYLASNTVVVTINDLSLASKVIDAAAGSGANRIEGISFTLKDDSDVQARALAEAAAKARASAEAIAHALNLQIIGVLQAEAGGGTSPIRPMMMQARAMGAMSTAQPTPVEAGNIEVHASVTVTLQVQ